MADENLPEDEHTTPDPQDKTAPDGDNFPREYVQRLRTESAGHRTQAREARDAIEPLRQRLHALLVAGTGRLADPSDLPYDAAHLDNEAALSAALDALLTAKPHLASRRVRGDIGQGVRPPSNEFNLARLLAVRA